MHIKLGLFKIFVKAIFQDGCGFRNQFCLVVKKFLGNCKSSLYASIFQDFLSSYKNLRARISLKIHFLHSHLDFFPLDMGKISNEHGERFHQEIKEMENLYHGRVVKNILAD